MTDLPTPDTPGGPPAPEPPAPGDTGPAHAPPSPPRRPRRGLGNVVLGTILVLLGVAWLLQALDVVDVPWRALLPSALVVVGVALVVGARTGRHGGLIALGVVLTVAVGLASAIDVLVDIPITGGIGDETYRVRGIPEDEYRLAIGSMTVDLREAVRSELGTEIEASVAIGELVVIVPSDAPYRIDAHTGLGEVDVFGEEDSGFGPDVEATREGTGGRLVLDLDVGLGRVEVRR